MDAVASSRALRRAPASTPGCVRWRHAPKSRWLRRWRPRARCLRRWPRACATRCSTAASACARRWCTPRARCREPTPRRSTRPPARSSSSTPTRWCTTTFRAWTTTRCGAASRPCTWPSARRPRCWWATRCRRSRSRCSPRAVAAPDAVLAMVAELARAAGAGGMAGGQAIDLSVVGPRPIAPRSRTCTGARPGALLCASVRLGALAGERARRRGVAALDALRAGGWPGVPGGRRHPRRRGRSRRSIGKTAGKDSAQNKPTYVSVLGVAESRRLAASLRERAHEAIAPLGARASRLGELAELIVKQERLGRWWTRACSRRSIRRPTCARCGANSSPSSRSSCAPSSSTRCRAPAGTSRRTSGTVELAIALHYVFDTPRDRLVWDVGHQSYPHKILTGRRAKMSTLRQFGGISGFPAQAESEYDTFGTAHSSTSISAALGMAVASRNKGENQGPKPPPPRRRHRRRCDERGHGVRGDEQRRRHARTSTCW